MQGPKPHSTFSTIAAQLGKPSHSRAWCLHARPGIGVRKDQSLLACSLKCLSQGLELIQACRAFRLLVGSGFPGVSVRGCQYCVQSLSKSCKDLSPAMAGTWLFRCVMVSVIQTADKASPSPLQIRESSSVTARNHMHTDADWRSIHEQKDTQTIAHATHL